MATLAISGPAAYGARVAAFNDAVFAAYGRRCHLCGGAGADTSDHLIPTSQRPDLRWDIANARPAHGRCNFTRRDKPLSQRWSAQW